MLPRSCGRTTCGPPGRCVPGRLRITDPQQAVSFGPHPGPELEALREDSLRALEIAHEHAEIRAMSRGELEAQLLQADRAQAAAPPDTGSLLRATAQVEADAWQQAADAAVEHDQVGADNTRSLAAALAAEASRPEAANARYEEWSARTASTRESREGRHGRLPGVIGLLYRADWTRCPCRPSCAPRPTGSRSRAYPPPPELFCPSCLLGVYTLEELGPVAVAGRDAIAVAATPRRDVLGSGSAKRPYDRIEVAVDAELGILLRPIGTVRGRAGRPHRADDVTMTRRSSRSRAIAGR